MTEHCRNTPEAACGAPAPQAAFLRWIKLIVGFILIWALIFGVGSLAQRLPGAKRMAEVIDARGLRATAVYYTDFEEPAEGSERIRDSLDYTPHPAK
jgi:hypothetical protein